MFLAADLCILVIFIDISVGDGDCTITKFLLVSAFCNDFKLKGLVFTFRMRVISSVQRGD